MMIDKQTLFSIIDELPVEDLEALYQHIKQRRQVLALHTATGTHPVVAEPAHQAPAETIREEVNALIDNTLNQVRRKRETRELAKQGDQKR